MIYKRPTNAHYNCYGYALGTYCWEYMYNIHNKDGSLSFTRCVERILQSFPYIIRVAPSIIKTQNYDRKKYYAIAFRVGNNRDGWCDYHFMRQLQDGKWYQKCGSVNGIYLHKGDIALPWERRDSYVYDSQIAFFLVPRKRR